MNKHLLSFSKQEDVKNITTECLFQCSCREWRIEVPIPHMALNAFDGRDFGVHLIRMGMDAGRQFERHFMMETS